jgi:hypothetical protein
MVTVTKNIICKSTQEIYENIWNTHNYFVSKNIKKIPPEWNKNRPMAIDDVVTWEQIYHEPGNIGIYVSWSPRAEFYMIVYYLFFELPQGKETFYGINAHNDVLKKCSNHGICLPINKVYSNV